MVVDHLRCSVSQMQRSEDPLTMTYTRKLDPGYCRGVPFLGLEFQWLGVTRASNPVDIVQSYVFFIFLLTKSIRNAKVI